MLSMASRDAFDGFTFNAASSTKDIPVVVAVLISPSFKESPSPIRNRDFSSTKTTDLYIGLFHHHI